VNADQYRCVHAACLTMAEQSDSLAVRTRWLTLAKDCQGFAKESSAERRPQKLARRFCGQ
jgi:hypothetical protein